MIRVTIQLPQGHPLGTLTVSAMGTDISEVIGQALSKDPQWVLVTAYEYIFATPGGIMIDVRSTTWRGRG